MYLVETHKIGGYPKTEIVKPKTEPKLVYKNRTEPKPKLAKLNRTENRKISNRAGPSCYPKCEISSIGYAASAVWAAMSLYLITQIKTQPTG